MKTIFRAVGPAFKQGLVVEPFESVNVYALLCELLGVTPEPHDGSLAAVKPMLRESRDPPPGPGTPPPPPPPAGPCRAPPGFPREQRHLAAAAPPAPATVRRLRGTGGDRASFPGPVAACWCPPCSPPTPPRIAQLAGPRVPSRSPRSGPRARQPGRVRFNGA